MPSSRLGLFPVTPAPGGVKASHPDGPRQPEMAGVQGQQPRKSCPVAPTSLRIQVQAMHQSSEGAPLCRRHVSFGAFSSRYESYPGGNTLFYPTERRTWLACSPVRDTWSQPSCDHPPDAGGAAEGHPLLGAPAPNGPEPEQSLFRRNRQTPATSIAIWRSHPILRTSGTTRRHPPLGALISPG